MVIDAAKGVEAQTRKLFKVCVMRDIPIFTFINKMDREARDPFELLRRDREGAGHRAPTPSTGPSAPAKNFWACTTGTSRRSYTSPPTSQRQEPSRHQPQIDLDDPSAHRTCWARPSGDQLHRGRRAARRGPPATSTSTSVRHGKLSPVFFGSALTTFGVEPFLEDFLRMTTPPLPRHSRMRRRSTPSSPTSSPPSSLRSRPT